MQYKVFFEKLTGFNPYAFQNKLHLNYSKKQSVILQAPTGSGKTWAAITPFIYSWYLWKNGKQKIGQFPKKLIYSLPLRTLANSLYQEVKTTINEKFSELNIKVSLQTGENREDEFLESDIIFTTIDQTLSNFLCIPLSLPQKLANINAGAILSAYLIFDEFHLLEPRRSLNTTISILNLIKAICPFCLMTATLSDQFLNKISKFLNASIVEIKGEEYKKFSFVKEKAVKSVSVADEVMNIENIIKQHKQKSIVICNTVDRCIETYKKIKQNFEKQEKRDTDLICIHSRFFQADRKSKETEIKGKFSKNSKANVMLVSTQIVEVGLDISCDAMHTELCPINSFLQRIGRCARWGDTGRIFVYDVPEQNYLPYDTELCISTLECLSNIEKQNLDFYLSQELIQKILAEKEKAIFREIQNNEVITWTGIKDCWRRNDKTNARELIRNINSISVVLLPEDFQTDSLYKYDSLSINPYSLKNKIEKIMDEFEGEIPSYILDLEESNLIDDEDDYEIKKLKQINYNDIVNKNVVALNSKLIGYSKDYGLDFQGNFIGGYESSKIKKQSKKQYVYYKDTYEEHIKWMIEIYEERIKDNILFPIRKIQTIKYAGFNFDEIIKYIIIMHDYGKLNNDWQKIMNTYQNAKEKHINKENEFLTHTDFDPRTEHDKSLMKETLSKLKIRKPNHAGVGAFLSYCILPHILNLEKTDENNQILKIVLTTILRHHGVRTTKMPNYDVSDKAIKFINDNLLKSLIPKFYVDNTIKFPFEKYRAKDLTSRIVQFGNPHEAFIYFILVRILRLCDQKSFKKNPCYMEDSNG